MKRIEPSQYGSASSKASENQQSFLARMEAMTDQPPRMEAALAYDDMMVLANALNSCPAEPIDVACVAQALAKTDYVGVGGRLTFDALRRSNRDDLLLRIENGVWVRAF